MRLAIQPADHQSRAVQLERFNANLPCAPLNTVYRASEASREWASNMAHLHANRLTGGWWCGLWNRRNIHHTAEEPRIFPLTLVADDDVGYAITRAAAATAESKVFFLKLGYLRVPTLLTK